MKRLCSAVSSAEIQVMGSLNLKHVELLPSFENAFVHFFLQIQLKTFNTIFSTKEISIVLNTFLIQ